MLMHGKTCDPYIDLNPDTSIYLYMPTVSSIFGDKGKQCRPRSSSSSVIACVLEEYSPDDGSDQMPIKF